MKYKRIVSHDSFEEMERYVEWLRSEEGKEAQEMFKKLKPVLDKLK